jgi:hypothetical protein
MVEVPKDYQGKLHTSQVLGFGMDSSGNQAVLPGSLDNICRIGAVS